MSMIKVRDLWKSYGRNEVLKGLNLDVDEGEVVVILGRSGVGKSVLLRQIMGIERPDKGTIEINGVRITDLPPDERFRATRGMGMLFQGGALFDSMNVGDNIAFYLREHEDLSEREIQHRVSAALTKVGLDGTLNTMPSDLSGGMRKRAAIARLIVYRPQIALYDEPTTGLDPITAMQIVELINKTRKEMNATGIVVTHDVKAARELGDKLAFHHHGKLTHCVPKDEFFKLDDSEIKKFLENANIT